MAKRILIASSAFYPENSPRSFRATELAKALADMGHVVRVITIDRGQPTKDFCAQNKIELEYIAPLKFQAVAVRSGKIAGIISRIIRRAMLQLFEFPDIELYFRYKKALKKYSGYDLLFSSAVPYPVHWGVAAVWKENRKPAKVWVADCGDPYMGNRIDSFRKPFYFKWVEKWFCRKADFIAIPIEEARVAYYQEFQDKIVIIPQGLKFQDYRLPAHTFTPNAVVTFGYAGSFIPGKRDPRLFLEYLLKSDRPFRFFIYTEMGDLISDLAARSGGRIVVKRYVPRKELIATFSTFDFLVNFENTTSEQAPSKLIDYYLTGRPVLPVNFNTIDQEKVERFMSRDYRDAMKLENYERFDISNVSRQFLSLIEK